MHSPLQVSPKYLPAPPDPRPPAAAVPVEMYRAAMPPPENEEDAATPLSQYFWALKRHRWKILLFVLGSVAATLVVSKRLVPVYEATATVDVDRQSPAGIIGQEATRSILNDADQFLATQVRLIQSDSVLRPVAERYHLRELERGGADEPTERAQDAPVALKRLKVARPPNTYLLLISYRSPDAKLAAHVANAVAQSYLTHTYDIRIRSSASLAAFMEKQLEELKAKMERSSAALGQFERELNVINPEEKTSILSARLLQLNTEYTNTQTDRMRKETAFRSVRSGGPEAAQVSSQGEALKKMAERLDEAQEKFTEVRLHYGVNHPEYRKSAAMVAEIQRQLQQARENTARRVEIEYHEAAARETMLQAAVNATKAEFDGLNSRSFEYQSLKREAEADKRLYEELIRKIKEAGINSGFQNSAVRIADLARPPLWPVFPNLRLNLVLAALLATVLAIGAAIGAEALNDTVRDPEQTARSLTTEVIGALPVVKTWHGRLAVSPVGRADLAASPQAEHLSTFEEAVRTLRNSILLADFDRRLRSIMITSSGPSEGKSTVSSHLAAIHAQQGRKTLLIDGDLRRPSLHRQFGLEGKVGLSTVLTGEMGWREAITRLEHLPNLDLLLAGPPCRRAADLVGTGLTAVLEAAAREYDLVVLDSPPFLGFPEPLQMAAAVDGVLLVALSGRTSRKALGASMTALKRLRANVVGLIFNEVRADTGNGYYQHYYHSKYYKYYRQPAQAD